MKKNILLIGGSQGIGFSIAKNLAENHNVYVASRNKQKLDDLKVTHLEFDALKEDSSKLDLPETLHGFVYCPGSIVLRPFKSLNKETFEEDLRINFIGMVSSLHGVLKKLTNADAASIVLFSTVAVKLGMPFHTCVSASKGAIEGFAKAFAAEYAPKIRCNVIAPSLTDTPLASKILSDEDKKEASAAKHPLKKLGKPEDIASMASFLLEDKSSWITGQVYGVDGGISSLKTSV